MPTPVGSDVAVKPAHFLIYAKTGVAAQSRPWNGTPHVRPNQVQCLEWTYRTFRAVVTKPERPGIRYCLGGPAKRPNCLIASRTSPQVTCLLATHAKQSLVSFTPIIPACCHTPKQWNSVTVCTRVLVRRKERTPRPLFFSHRLVLLRRASRSALCFTPFSLSGAFVDPLCPGDNLPSYLRVLLLPQTLSDPCEPVTRTASASGFFSTVSFAFGALSSAVHQERMQLFVVLGLGARPGFVGLPPRPAGACRCSTPRITRPVVSTGPRRKQARLVGSPTLLQFSRSARCSSKS